MFGPLRTTKLLTSQQYWRRLTLLWVYSLAWIAGIAALATYWRKLPWPVSLILAIILMLGTPALSDMLRSYAQYRQKWERDNA